MIEPAAILALLTSGTVLYTLTRRARAHARWRRLLEAVAGRLGGRASPATVLDAPELRATIEGVPVTLKLRDIHVPAKGTATAETKLSSTARAEALRLYLGWGVSRAPAGVEHFPELDLSLAQARVLEGVEGFVARSNDAAAAHAFVLRAGIDLVDIGRESLARVIRVQSRGGYLQLVIEGLTENEAMVERLAIVAARATNHLEAALDDDGARGERATTPLSAPTRPCCLCEKASAGAWIECARCGAPYHAACFSQATGCVVAGCGETTSVALREEPFT